MRAVQRLLVGVQRGELDAADPGRDEAVHGIGAGATNAEHDDPRSAFSVVLKHGRTPSGGPFGRDSWEEVSEPGLQCGAHALEVPGAGPLITRGELLASPGEQTNAGRERGTANRIRQAVHAEREAEPSRYAEHFRGQ